jgi:hypothetical protein
MALRFRLRGLFGSCWKRVSTPDAGSMRTSPPWYPEMTAAVLGDGLDRLADHGGAAGVARRLPTRLVELIEAVVGTEPEGAVLRVRHAQHLPLTGDRIGAEALVRAIVSAHAGARADPEDAVAVLGDEVDVVAGERRAVVADLPEVPDRVAVEAVQPSARAEPHEAA